MIETIKKLVEAETTLNNIERRIRTQEFVDARIIYTVLALKHTKLSYARIAKLIDRNHCSIIHYQKIYSQWRRTPERFSNHLRSIDGIDKIIEKGREEIDSNMDIIIMFKKKNALLEKQVNQLLSTIDKQEAKIKELKKYEPIW